MARSRAVARARWPVRLFDLGHEPSDDLSATTTVDERLAMMRPLALAAWAVMPRARSRPRSPLLLFVRKPRRRLRRP